MLPYSSTLLISDAYDHLGLSFPDWAAGMGGRAVPWIVLDAGGDGDRFGSCGNMRFFRKEVEWAKKAKY